MTKHDPIHLDEVPAARLVIAPENPRSAEKVDETAVGLLKDNISAVGLLSPVVGYYAEDGTFVVTAGGRRTRAIARLIEAGDWTGDERVPVVPMNRIEAANAGNAEQLTHVGLDELDKIRLILSDSYKGFDPATLAKWIGKSELFVTQRRAIASLPDEVLDAMWDETISPTEAFGLTYFVGDDEGMAEAFEACCQPGEPYSISDLRRMFERRKTAWSRSNPARIVGKDAYLAAGGTLQTDLFTDDAFIDDPGLLHQLAKERVAEWLSERFPDAAFIRETDNIYHAPLFAGIDDLTEAEREEWEDHYMFRRYEHDPDAEPDWFARHDELQEKSRLKVPDAAKPYLGVVWEYRSMHQDCCIFRENVLPDDLEPFYENGWLPRPAEPGAEADENGEADASEGDGSSAPADPLSAALRKSVEIIEAHARRQKLSANPNQVIEDYLCALTRSTYNPDFTHVPDKSYHPDPDDPAFVYTAQWDEGERLAALDEDAIRALKPADQRKLMAHKMLRCTTTHKADPVVDAKAIRAVWHPTSGFLNRYSKNLLVEMLCRLGEDNADLEKMKKGALAAELAARAEADARWLPLGFSDSA